MIHYDEILTGTHLATRSHSTCSRFAESALCNRVLSSTNVARVRAPVETSTAVCPLDTVVLLSQSRARIPQIKPLYRGIWSVRPNRLQRVGCLPSGNQVFLCLLRGIGVFGRLCKLRYRPDERFTRRREVDIGGVFDGRLSCLAVRVAFR
ncbi:MAG: hypothetical protein J07HR59_00519 [Halorubrum sp. J07HR59]|nr:MAG: hypothetical protein J07HR59_00519 [Halorubrum sp. J07HR59]